ncbi:hypothetical protein Sa4125_20670 [Aureimonas sp. SA4125]|uniref:TfoX/Sxy family protein n=1 Tax=Aureimonas sp. SA4125 TaxID=2826993 RepID=UPI001E7EEC80|nr:hypothetical protein Sa4125_20670 [Aureimonas sp. SA4125]
MDEDLLREVFESLGTISVRRMFGGQGIYADGTIVALVVRGDLMLKGDAQSVPVFEAAGSTRWVYATSGRPEVQMPYFTAPGEIFDDPGLRGLLGGAGVRSGTPQCCFQEAGHSDVKTAALIKVAAARGVARVPSAR